MRPTHALLCATLAGAATAALACSDAGIGPLIPSRVSIEGFPGLGDEGPGRGGPGDGRYDLDEVPGPGYTPSTSPPPAGTVPIVTPCRPGTPISECNDPPPTDARLVSDIGNNEEVWNHGTKECRLITSGGAPYEQLRTIYWVRTSGTPPGAWQRREGPWGGRHAVGSCTRNPDGPDLAGYTENNVDEHGNPTSNNDPMWSTEHAEGGAQYTTEMRCWVDAHGNTVAETQVYVTRDGEDDRTPHGQPIRETSDRNCAAHRPT